MTSNLINWQLIHERIEQTEKMLSNKLAINPEYEQTLLHSRAIELAKMNITQANLNHSISILEFMLGNEHYGIELPYVGLVSKVSNMTSLPSIPHFVEGIINLHGKIICVANLARLIGLGTCERTALSRIIVASYNDIELGILVDRVNAIQSVDLNNLQTQLPVTTGIRAEYVKGITDKQLIILNAPLLMSHKDLIINQTV